MRAAELAAPDGAEYLERAGLQYLDQVVVHVRDVQKAAAGTECQVVRMGKDGVGCFHGHQRLVVGKQGVAADEDPG